MASLEERGNARIDQLASLPLNNHISENTNKNNDLRVVFSCV